MTASSPAPGIGTGSPLPLQLASGGTDPQVDLSSLGPGGVEQQQKLQRSLLILLGGLLLVSGATALLRGAPSLGIPLLLLAPFAALGLVLIRRSESLVLGSHLTCMIAWLAATVEAATSQQVLGVNLVFHALIPLMALLTLGNRAGLGWLAWLITTDSALWITNQTGLLRSLVEPRGLQLPVPLALLVGYGVAFAIGFIFRRSEQEAHQHLANTNLSLRSASEASHAAVELTQRSRSLEQEARQEAERMRLDADQARELVCTANAQLAALDAQKTAFFQNISHELRTPLTLIISSLEKEQRQNNGRYISVASRNTRRLLRLVNQLLDFQKLQAGKRDLSLSAVDVTGFLHTAASYFSAACEERHLQLDVRFHDESPNDAPPTTRPAQVFALAEIDALEKVVFNFLSNAMKFTPPGGRIELKLARRERRIRLSVKDEGPGIHERDKAHIFEAFAQLDTPAAGGDASSGLGLALARELAEAMQGSVGVHSTPGKGSTFYLDLRHARPDQLPLSVLVVMADAPLADQASNCLQDVPRSEIMHSLRDAQHLLEQRKVQVLAVDLALEVTRRNGVHDLLDAAGRNCKRILLVDGYPLQADPVDHWARHVDQLVAYPWQSPTEFRAICDFATSPEQKSSIPSALSLQMGLPRVNSDANLANPAPPSLPVPANARKPEQKHILVVDDLKDMRDLVREMLEESGYAVSTASSGRMGWEVARDDPPDLIITDWMMPGMAGSHLIERLRRKDQTRSIPIILLTAKYDEETRARGIALGADAFVGKPFDARELLSTVRNMLRLKARERALAAAHKDLEAASQQERMHSQEMLIQAEKLASIGQLVASVGHEIANPVGFLQMSRDLVELQIDRLEEEFTLNEDRLESRSAKALHEALSTLRTSMEDQDTATLRLAELSSALRSQARKDVQALAGVGINEIVRESLVIVSGKTRPFEIDLQLGEVPTISCHRSQIGQVLTNLCANAADAVAEKMARAESANSLFTGKIRVLSQGKTLQGQPGVCIQVGDNGQGVPPELRERVFEAFFTTKSSKQGTGLGLSICATIIQDHGGQIRVLDDEQLNGALFQIWLPADTDSLTAPALDEAVGT